MEVLTSVGASGTIEFRITETLGSRHGKKEETK
jgi:hypothetical protein